MGEQTGIEWAHGPHKLGATWNPWRGCHKVSPACAHCYMFREQRAYGNNPNVVVRCSPATFYAPLKWKEPHGIFKCSWSDFFVAESDPWRIDAWHIIAATQHHTYLILTKRPERIPEIEWPLLGLSKNVWAGVSVENAKFYWRIDALRKIKPNLLFLSIEPLLGPMSDLPLDGVDWVIVGGESGPKWRPLNIEWVRQIRDRCVERGVPFFFKQWSGLHPKGLGRLLDGRTWNEFPSV
jgi:protein gp37